MKYEVCPVIDIDDLANALNRQYAIDMDGADLTEFLFGDDFQNDCYKSFYYGEMEVYRGDPWQSEERIRINNCLRSILQGILPEYKMALIDVSW